MREVCCAAVCAVLLAGCAGVESGAKVATAAPPIKLRFEFASPDFMFRTALTEARLDRIGCTFESFDRDANRRLRSRLFESLAMTLPSERVRYEPRNKLVFYFEDGKVETLVFSRRYDNRDAIAADWQGQGARVANSLPAELARHVRNAHLPQLNPQAQACDFLARE